MKKTTIVISHYKKRAKIDLENLLGDLKRFDAEILVVINDDDAYVESSYLAMNVRFIVRPNKGMNIGGWSSAISHCSDFDQLIFLQDECRVINDEFIDCYADKLGSPTVGMIGESLNYKWDYPWNKIYQSSLNYQINFSNGISIDRVSYYLNCMNKWGVDPGTTGLHLRSLVWGFGSKVIPNIIKAFPEGSNKEECISAEISVSKIISQAGYIFCQSAESPFKFFSHKEWRSDGKSKI